MKAVFHSGNICQVTDDTIPGMFRQLSEEEVCDFRAWADDQEDDVVINSVWHPVVQDQLFITGKGQEE